jgi:lipopolysaccharide assembly outer membrane protein LptD (OstA)
MPAQVQDKSAAKAIAKKRRDGVRVFANARIRLMRMGRVVATYHSAYARLDLKEGRVDFQQNARVSVGSAFLSAENLSLDLARNRLTAEGKVSITERGVKLDGGQLTALPSLTGMKFKGQVRLRADDRESAAALLQSGLF